MSSASATVLVDRLEHAGHVRRRRDSSDRRRIVLEVTDTAAARSLDAVRPMTDAINAIGEQLDEPTRQVIATYLARVAEVMATFTDTTIHVH
jgi:DNA-binding MarR family transcriptional regulator